MSNNPLPKVEAGSSFRFVVLTDTHINASETTTSSPWAINRHANARARAAVTAINRIAPDFAIHLGDVIQPLPGHSGYDEASRCANEILDKLQCPLMIIPGNHDVGDKPLRWNPAKPVSEFFVKAFRRDYGHDRLSFEHAGCMFIGIDVQLINSGIQFEAEQWLWIEETLVQAQGKRVFFFVHYPPFICAPDEHEHYDNLGEPGRSRLLALFEKHQIEACFSGHVHNFFYNRIGHTRSYTLPALSFVRHDYSGLFPTPPADESFGRNDGAKLGFLTVDVGAEGHSIRFLRSYGRGEKAGEDPAPDLLLADDDHRIDSARHTPFREPFGSSRPVPSGFGATLRASWAHVTEIGASGAVDEFRRKPARDDYLIAALWESGVTRLRIPLDDIADHMRRNRVELLASDGYVFQVYCFGLPDAQARAALTASRRAISALEIILPLDDMEMAVHDIESLGSELDCETIISPLVQSGSESGKGIFVHFIAHGFAPDEDIPHQVLNSDINGLSFRIGHDQDPLDHAQRCSQKAQVVGKSAHIQIAAGNSNPAIMDHSAIKTRNRALLAYIASQCCAENTSIWLDTISDVDRGYFPRLGLIDGRSNPGMAAVAVDTLAEKLSGHTGWTVADRKKLPNGENIVLTSGAHRVHLTLTD